MSRITMLGLLVAFALVASGVCSPAELFGARPPVSAKDGESTLSHTVVPGGKSILTDHVRKVTINHDVLASRPDFLSLSLLPGVTVVVESHSDTEDHGYGDRTLWSGHIKGAGPGESSAVFVTGPDGSFDGHVRFHQQSEDINGGREYHNIVVASDPKSGHQEGFIYKDEDPKNVDNFQAAQDLPESVRRGVNVKMSGSDTDLLDSANDDIPHRQLVWMQRPTNVVHDILVVYTEGAASGAGDDSAVINKILITIAQTNQVYNDSAIPVTLRLVTQPIKVLYNESGSENSFSDAWDGRVPGLISLREQYGADLVLMVTSDNDTNGYSGGYPCGAYAFPSVGYSLLAHSGMNQACLVNGGVGGSPLLARLMGYTLGCNRYENIGLGYAVTDNGYGYKRCDLGESNFGTIMTNACMDGNATMPTTRLWLYSNPNINVTRPNGNSYPVGDKKTSFCARAIAQTASIVSKYRDAPKIGHVGTLPPIIDCSSL